MKPEELRTILKKVDMTRLPVRFKGHSSYFTEDETECFLTTMSSMPSALAEAIIGLMPIAPLLLELWEAAELSKEKFMAMDDGYFVGLIPPEFSDIAGALTKLKKHDQ